MNNLEKNSYVLTTYGFKGVNNISLSDYVYTSSKTIDKVINNKSHEIQRLSEYFLLQNSIDDLSYIVSKRLKVLSVNNQTFDFQEKSIANLNIDDWLYHPWITKRSQDYESYLLDLAKTSSNFHDSTHIYLFNNSVLGIAKKLNIPQEAVKQILIREAKEYENYIPLVYDFIKKEYNIEYDNSDPETSFREFKRFVKDTFVFKMNRFVNVDYHFTSFVIATLTRCRINKISNGDNSFLYELSFKFDKKKDKPLLQSVLKFIKSVGSKYEEKVENNKTIINVFNKPLHDFVTSILVQDLKAIVGSSAECQEYFVNSLFENRSSINVGLNVAIQIKELFMYHKKVLGIKQYTEGVILEYLHDDLDQLESSLIIEDDGYYSKVSSLIPFENLYTQYTSVSIKDKRIIHLGFTECL